MISSGFNLWQFLANYTGYDFRLMKYCPLLKVKTVNIAILLSFQLVLILLSSMLLYQTLFTPYYLIIGYFVDTTLVYLHYRVTIVFLRLCHGDTAYTSTIIVLYSLLFSSFVSLSICLFLFNYEVVIQMIEAKVNQEFWLKPYGLFLVCSDSDNANIITTLCIMIAIFVEFIVLYPYWLICQDREALYHIIKKHYEKRFKS